MYVGVGVTNAGGFVRKWKGFVGKVKIKLNPVKIN